ncbi:ras-related protein Rab-36 isoform X2 [Macaca thibetana thibetana]|uniref:ras-related protein Rab-36 isoform X2 n=1 Tax=Macaca thibetana thibetana TaxID=257877 RepID=UPI00075FA627|nr:ras-related protein Rab-36 isoform X2 [Macaca thibetana thibetana]
MRSSLTPLGPPVSRDRVIATFPKWYTPEACLQLREHFHRQVSAACQRRNTGTVGLKLSKVVVVGDLYVGKTSLIHRFCKNVFDRDYKATIGVDFEIERFEIAGIPYSLQIWDTAGQEKFKCIASAYYRGAQVIITAFDLTDVQTLEHTRQWLEDALRENEAGSCFIFLVGTKKDLLSGAACEQVEAEAVHLAKEMQAEYWSVSAKTGEWAGAVSMVGQSPALGPVPWGLPCSISLCSQPSVPSVALCTLASQPCCAGAWQRLSLPKRSCLISRRRLGGLPHRWGNSDSNPVSCRAGPFSKATP